MATLLQHSASRKAHTTTGTVTSAILTAGASALNSVHSHVHPHHAGTGVTTSNGSIKKVSESIVNGTHIQESTADASVKIKSSTHDNGSIHHHDSKSESTANSSTHHHDSDLSVKIKPNGYDNHTHGYEKPKPTGYERKPIDCDSDVYEKYKKSTSCETSICITEEQKRILHQGTCSLGDALSQVPWMKFRLIAEPNMDCFSSDHRLKTFIRQVTELTVSIVTKQCTDEIAVLIAVLVANLTSTMQVRVKLIMETIIEQIASLCLEDSITACQNLEGIKEKICYPKHHDHSKYGTHDKHYDPHGPHHDTHGGSDKPKYPRDSCDDSDKHARPSDCEC